MRNGQETCAVLPCDDVQPLHLVDDAVASMNDAINLSGWHGPARNAFDEIATALRDRLIAVSIRVHALG